jgi:hypothetical protein
MSCWTAWTSGSTGGDGLVVTTGAAALVVAVGCVGGSDCGDGRFAVAEGGGGVAASVGAAPRGEASGWSVGSGSGAAVGGATTAGVVGEAVAAWVATSRATACAAALGGDASAGDVVRPAKNPIPTAQMMDAVGTAHVARPRRKAVSARAAQIERPLRKGELSMESSATDGSETATGGMGVEGGTGTAALAGTRLAAGAGAACDGLAAMASTGSGSATSSASKCSSSTTW